MIQICSKAVIPDVAYDNLLCAAVDFLRKILNEFGVSMHNAFRNYSPVLAD
jgi:hypothetical protein